jgi:hypothetical protein
MASEPACSETCIFEQWFSNFAETGKQMPGAHREKKMWKTHNIIIIAVIMYMNSDHLHVQHMYKLLLT